MKSSAVEVPPEGICDFVAKQLAELLGYVMRLAYAALAGEVREEFHGEKVHGLLGGIGRCAHGGDLIQTEGCDRTMLIRSEGELVGGRPYLGAKPGEGGWTADRDGCGVVTFEGLEGLVVGERRPQGALHLKDWANTREEL